MNEETQRRLELQARRPWFRSLFSSDRAMVATGIGLAAFAAFFPWYVFLHQEEFGVKPMVYSGTRELSGWAGNGLFDASPLALSGEGDAVAPSIDALTTATVSTEAAEDEGPEYDPLDQPFPEPNPYRLLHVSNGRALIEDQSGMYIVRIGSVLPDNSRLDRLERRDGEWVIVTSDGAVVAR